MAHVVAAMQDLVSGLAGDVMIR